MKTTNGKLKQITCGILHTEIKDVYLFFEEYMGVKGIMTHQLPSACKALEPILKNKLPAEWFLKEYVKDQEWQQKLVEIPELTMEEKGQFWQEYENQAMALFDKIKDKTIIIKTGGLVASEIRNQNQDLGSH